MPEAAIPAMRTPRRWASAFGGPAASRENLPIVLLAAGIASVTIGRLAVGMITCFLTDDAFYYAVIARNLAAGRGWTFDGVTVTNGAHPLLLGLEVVVAFLMGPRAEPIHFYRALVVMFAVVFLVFLWVLARLMKPASIAPESRPFVLSMWLAVGAMFLPPALGLTSVGMESSVAFPLGAIFFVLWFRERDVAAGLVGAALVAARLDTAVYFLAPLALFRVASAWATGEGPARALGRGLALLAPAALFLAAYTTYNTRVFGWPMPIHGVLKSSFPHVNLQLSQLLGPPGGLASRLTSPHVLIHFVFLTAVVLMLRGGRPVRPIGLAIAALLLVSVVSQASFALFLKWSKPTPNWYLWQPAFVALLALFLAATRVVSEQALRFAGGSLGLLLAVQGALGVVHYGVHGIRHWGDQPTFWHTPARDYLASQPENELWAATDCGLLSFWSGRRILDLDGLVAGFELQERIAKKELGRYLAEVGVTRVLGQVWDRWSPDGREYEIMYRSFVNPAALSGDYDHHRLSIYSYQYMTHSDTLRLYRTQETWRSPLAWGGGIRSCDIAYDLRRAPPEAQAPEAAR